MFLATFHKFDQSLLLCCSKCPSAGHNGTLQLIYQLRSLHGEKVQSCYWPPSTNLTRAFCCAAANALVQATMARCSSLISCCGVVVRNSNHVLGYLLQI